MIFGNQTSECFAFSWLLLKYTFNFSYCSNDCKCLNILMTWDIFRVLCNNKWLYILWILLTCLFKFFFCPNVFLQIKQVNGFTFSWTLLTCNFKVPFCPNDCLQIKQENGFKFPCTLLTCLFKLPFSPNDCLQIKQENGFKFPWRVVTCLFKCPFCPNDCLQIKQENGFKFSWTVLTCNFKYRDLPKDCLQIRHTNEALSWTIFLLIIEASGLWCSLFTHEFELWTKMSFTSMCLFKLWAHQTESFKCFALRAFFHNPDT